MTTSSIQLPAQPRLIPPQNMSVDFSPTYSNKHLINTLNELEITLGIISEQERFGDQVNTSISKSQPYHRWARYREGYSGVLVRELIGRSNLDPRRHFTFDPMCGSGSTLVTSVQIGYDSLGCDVNPYSVDLTNAKLWHYTEDQVKQVEYFINNPLTDTPHEGYPGWQSLEDSLPYYRETHLNVLRQIKYAVEKQEDESVKHLLFVAWLSVLEDCSEKKKDGNGLASRPSKVTDVWSHFSMQVSQFLYDIRNNPLPSSATAYARKHSALNCASIVDEFAATTGKEVGAIVFSPPYANSFDYFESYKLELLGGYYSANELANARQDAIRNYRKGYGYDLTTEYELVQMLCEEVRTRIPLKETRTGRVDNRSRLVPNLLVGYFEDMGVVLEQFSQCMPSGSSCHIVVDQSAYLGVIIPTDLVLADIAMRKGFEVESLIFCRSAKTSSQQMKQYPYLKSMLRESILSLTRK